MAQEARTSWAYECEGSVWREMWARDGASKLRSSAVHGPVTALHFLSNNRLLAGSGAILRLYNDGHRAAELPVLPDSAIHGIRPLADSSVIVFGRKALALVAVDAALELILAAPTFSDWILDAVALELDAHPGLAVALAHNAVQLCVLSPTVPLD